MKFIIVLFSLVVIGTFSSTPVYAAVQLNTPSDNSRTCTNNSQCDTDVCSDITYRDGSPSDKKCTSCGASGAASCTAPSTCGRAADTQIRVCTPSPSQTSGSQNPTSSAGNQNPSSPSGSQNPSNPSGTINDPVGPSGSQPAGDGNTLRNPLNGVNTLEDLLNAVLGAVVFLGSMALVVALVWVGALFVFAQGQEEKIREARNALMWTVIGGLILLGAQSIALVIESTTRGL